MRARFAFGRAFVHAARLGCTGDLAMDTRASIDAILDKAYAARQNNDAESAAALFADDARFAANGAPPRGAAGGPTRGAQGPVRGVHGDRLPRALPRYRSAARRGALARHLP